MAGPLIVGCIGSADPLLREYVHDFGLCTLGIIGVEQALRDLLENLGMLRAEWHAEGDHRGLKGKKVLALEEKHSETTLGGLVSAYERGGGNPELVAVLRPLAESRNVLQHNHVPLTNPQTLKMTSERIQEVRTMLRDLSRQAFDVGNAVQKEDAKVFAQLIERLRRDGVPPGPYGVRLEDMLMAYERTIRSISAA